MSKFKERLSVFVKGEKLSSAALTAVIIGLVIVVNVLVFVLDAYFGIFIYTPTAEELTISGATDAYFEDAANQGRKVKIMFCRAEDEVENNSAGKFVLDTAKQFAERYPDFIELDFLNIVRKVNGKGEYIDLSKYQEEVNGKKVPLLKSSVIFECGDNSKVLTDGSSNTGYSDFYTVDASGNIYSYNGEETIAAMIMWTLASEHKTAYLTTHHGETADFGFRNMLVCAGYNVSTLDIRSNDIPSDAGIVIISNPVKDFEMSQEGSNVVAEIDRLREFMLNGGKIYAAIDPYGPELPVLENFLSEFGIRFSVSEGEGGEIRNIVRDADNAITTDFYTLVATAAKTGLGEKMSETVKGYTNSDVIVRESAVLLCDSERGAEPLLLTSSSAELYAAGKKVGESGEHCVLAVSNYLNEDGAIGSLVVSPSIYLTATDALTSEGYANRTFVYSLMEEVFGAEKLPYGCNPVSYTEEVLENLTMKTARIYAGFILAVPAILAAIGIAVTVRRKNR